MLKSFLLFGLMTSIFLQEIHCSTGILNISQQNLQGSVKSRIQRFEQAQSQGETKPQIGEKLPQKPERLRLLPIPPSHQQPVTPQIVQQTKQEEHPKSPSRPQQPTPSYQVQQKGEVRHHCQSVPPGHLRILAIDGGGVRGLIPARVIEEIEKDLGLSITKIFHIFVGNSAGGMLALILTKPNSTKTGPEYTAAQVVEIIKDLSAKMFGGTQITTLDKVTANMSKAKNMLTTGAKYNPEILEELSTNLYGNTTLSESTNPVFVTTYDLNSETLLVLSTPLAKRSKLFDFKAADIARSTSAAPFFFPVHPLEFKNNESGTGLTMQLIDGGVGSNNPTLNGIMSVSKEYCTVPTYEILSLGTGTSKAHFERLDMTRKAVPYMMLNPTIKGFMKAQTQNADDTTKEFINILNSFSGVGKSNYRRLQVYYSDNEEKKLDDVSEHATENLLKKAQTIIDSTAYKETIQRLKKQLCDEGIYQRENLHSKMCSVH